MKDALVRFGAIKDWRILETAQWIPRGRGEVFAFFSDAHNLESITPPMLRFEVLSRRPIEMRAGLLIDYRIRLRGLPLRWQSEITAWEPLVEGAYRSGIALAERFAESLEQSA